MNQPCYVFRFTKIKDDEMETLALLLTLLLLIGIGTLFYGWANRCPGCKRLFAALFSIKRINRELLRENTYELGIWKRNLLTDLKVIPVKRVYFVKIYLDKYRCNKCGYHFSHISKEISFKDIELVQEANH